MSDDDEFGGAPAEPGESRARSKPNILVTGTPGTGKTCTCELLRAATSFNYVNVGQLIRSHDFHAGHDPEFDTFVMDDDAEDRLLDHMETIMVRTASCVCVCVCVRVRVCGMCVCV